MEGTCHGETDGSGKPNVYWLVVRPDIESDTLASDAPNLHSLAQGVQNRGTTTCTDLLRTHHNKRPRVEDDSDDEIFEPDQLPPPAPPDAALPLPRPALAVAEPASLAPSPVSNNNEPEPPPSRQTTAEAPSAGMTSGSDASFPLLPHHIHHLLTLRLL